MVDAIPVGQQSLWTPGIYLPSLLQDYDALVLGEQHHDPNIARQILTDASDLVELAKLKSAVLEMPVAAGYELFGKLLRGESLRIENFRFADTRPGLVASVLQGFGVPSHPGDTGRQALAGGETEDSIGDGMRVSNGTMADKAAELANFGKVIVPTGAGHILATEFDPIPDRLRARGLRVNSAVIVGGLDDGRSTNIIGDEICAEARANGWADRTFTARRRDSSLVFLHYPQFPITEHHSRAARGQTRDAEGNYRELEKEEIDQIMEDLPADSPTTRFLEASALVWNGFPTAAMEGFFEGGRDGDPWQFLEAAWNAAALGKPRRTEEALQAAEAAGVPGASQFRSIAEGALANSAEIEAHKGLA